MGDHLSMKDSGNYRHLTVAAIRESAEVTEVLFLESPRFYRLAKSHPSYNAVLALLRNAQADHSRLQVSFSASQSDLIESVCAS
jgi:hypothetical protein